MRFSIKYMPTALFSLKDSNATNSGAKALFLPSPYAIKMAILNQAITVGGDLEYLEAKKSLYFSYIRDAQISFYIEDESYFSVNNSFVKILKPAREGGGFGQTVTYREYVYFSKPLEIIFETQKTEQKKYLQKYLHNINYFGKRGCFFQFLGYSDAPSEANVRVFQADLLASGILQEYDDFDPSVTFENVSNFSSKNTKRKKQIMVIPLESVSSSKSYTLFKSFG
jgi:hypothetical protein